MVAPGAGFLQHDIHPVPRGVRTCCDALWSVTVRVPREAEGIGTCMAAINFGPGLAPSIRLEVRLDAARRPQWPAEPSPS
jgi:hypothetical protein